MKRMTFSLIMLFGILVLGGCGGKDDEATVEDQPVEAAKPKKANNPLAMEQQLLRDARGIQSLISQDAERKKKAIKNAN